MQFLIDIYAGQVINGGRGRRGCPWELTWGMSETPGQMSRGCPVGGDVQVNVWKPIITHNIINGFRMACMLINISMELVGLSVWGPWCF